MSSDDTRTEASERRPRRRGAIVALGIAAIALGAGAVYGIGFAAGNGEASACAADPARLQAMKAKAQGEVAAVIVPDRAEALPEMSFVDGEGNERSLAEWRGKVVLLNLWATWCAPCREEMPALDALQAEMGGEDFEIVPVSLDRGGPEKPRKFLQETGIENLKLYRDPKNEIFNTLKRRGQAFGLPTTLLVDPQGCQIGHLPGPADWASDDAKALIETTVGEGASG